MADDRRSPFADLAVVRGWPEARETIADWVRRPVGVFGPWLALAAGIGILLLVLVWIVGSNAAPSPGRPNTHLLEVRDWQADAVRLFRNNVLVLALHGFACLAGFIVYTAMRDPAAGDHPRLEQWTRSIALVAVLFVPIATILSIVTQAWVLGSRAATLADNFHLTAGTILRSTLPHSLPELAAVFLPLAAAILLQLRGRADQLLAATLASVVIAVPVIAVAAVIEARTWPGRLVAARAANPNREGMQLGKVVLEPADTRSGGASLIAGPQIGDGHTDLAEAERAASAAGRLVVVMSAEERFVVNEVYAHRQVHICDHEPGQHRSASPMRAEELARLKLEPGGRFSNEVVAFFNGATRMPPSSFDPGRVVPSFRQCDPEPTG